MSAASIASARAVRPSAEGYRQFKYIDTTGHESIGCGFNITAGISVYAATALNLAQMEERQTALAVYWWAQGLDDVRMSVVVELAFNDGVGGLLHFPKMLAAIGAKDWSTAKAELLDSDAASTLPTRYQTLATILFTGVNQ